MEREYLHGRAFVKKSKGKIQIFETPYGLGDFVPVVAEGTTKPRMLKDRFADVVNVKDFGAVGDGKTDDTEAIKHALAGGRKTVFFPSGVYLVDVAETLPIDMYTKIVGESPESSVIRTTETDKSLPHLFLVRGSKVSIENLGFEGGRSPAACGEARGREGVVKYAEYGYSGLKVVGCRVEDFFGATIHTLASDTTVERCDFARCSLYTHDLSPMYGVVSSWTTPSASSKAIENVLVRDCTFDRPGLFATLFLRVNGLCITGNRVHHASGIGFGNQWCKDVTIGFNGVAYSYLNGIDLQCCERQVVACNTLFASGWQRQNSKGEADLCQSIFVGDDYQTGTEQCRSAVITNNTITGIWEESLFGADLPQQYYSVGTGIVVNNASEVTISGNVVRGMGLPYTSDRISSEDGMGIRVQGESNDFTISANIISSVKGHGVFVGPCRVQNGRIVDNSITSSGEDGIHVYVTTLCNGLNISDNCIRDPLNIYRRAISAGVFAGASKSYLSELRITGNTVYATASEDTPTAEKKFSHGVYVGVDYLSTEAKPFCGLGAVIVRDNFANGYDTALVDFDSRCYSSSSSRHYRSVEGNRQGGATYGDGIVADIRSRKGVMEFVAPSQPTSGSYLAGDVVWHPYPSQNPIGWICTASGTPGTWRELQYVIPSN